MTRPVSARGFNGLGGGRLDLMTLVATPVMILAGEFVHASEGWGT